jgi:hypothetical protein
MNAWSLRSILAIGLLALTAVSAMAAGTAREAIQDATAAARKWQGDAVLTHLSTLQGRGDGRGDSWLYTFYSPGAKKSAIVTARDKKIEVDADVRNTSVIPLAAEFIDSDKAVQAAAKAGLKVDKSTKNVMLSVFVGNQAVGKPRMFWSVGAMSNNVISTVLLDGSDGAFIRRDDLK